ncbi:MAG: GTPase Era [Chloroflexi bacterium]|nr:GTPase Era [Chloroflexota bacterium]
MVEEYLAGTEDDHFQIPEGHRSGFVAVIGKPNVGKSTLINAILGEKVAIATPKPQTTRIQQLGILTRSDAQVIFIDTPGIHKPQHALGKFMVETAVRALQDADGILFLTDVSHDITAEDRNVAGYLPEIGAENVLIRVLNKVDLAGAPLEYQRRVDEHLGLCPFTEWLTTIASEGKGINDLVETLIQHLPEGPRYYPPDQVSDLWTREIAAEMIREAALLLTQEEVPHSVAVAVNEFKERPNGMLYISAELYVERDSQKGIVVGKGGRMIKQISSQAREEIEAFLKQRVYLDLHVKVLKNWRRDENALRRLGYRIER